MRSAELHSAISGAFQTVVRPSDAGLVSHRCDECDALAKDLRNYGSAQLPTSTVEKHWGDLPLLTAAAFHYFVPAYLHFAVDNPTSLVAEFVVNSLLPGKDAEFFRARYDLFSVPQRKVVHEVILAIEAADDDRDLDPSYAEAKQHWGAA